MQHVLMHVHLRPIIGMAMVSITALQYVALTRTCWAGRQTSCSARI